MILKPNFQLPDGEKRHDISHIFVDDIFGQFFFRKSERALLAIEKQEHQQSIPISSKRRKRNKNSLFF